MREQEINWLVGESTEKKGIDTSGPNLENCSGTNSGALSRGGVDGGIVNPTPQKEKKRSKMLIRI